nr:hypothetical protein [uncultured Roseateles sp.]
MLGANGFFIFFHSLEHDEAYSPQMAVVYKPPGPLLDGAVDEVLLALSKRPVQPDVVAFVHVDEGPALEDALASDGARNEWLRFRGRASLMTAAFNLKTGKVGIKHRDLAKRDVMAAFASILKNKLHEVIQTGLAEVFKKDEVILLAPAGYAYQKPSGKREEFFLKPDVALSSSASVGFMGFALLHKLGPQRLFDARELRYLYIDTMSIAPVAYALRDLITVGRQESTPLMVESFHSYGGIDNVDRPPPRQALCIISASTSMSMHQRWIETKRANAEDVVTLLTAAPVTLYEEGALFAIERPKAVSSKGPPQLCIELDGENFLPRAEPPKKVLLSELAHKTNETDVLRDLAGSGVFDAWRRPLAPGASPRALFVDGHALLGEEDFRRWLRCQLSLRVRAATRVILHQDDPASKEFATLIADLCQEQFHELQLRIESAADIEALSLQRSDGVLVCAAVIGKGSQLLEISRALRDLHEGPRLYVVGLQVTETRDETKTLPPNLEHSKPVKHEFAAYKTLAIGQQLGRSFADEVETYYDASFDHSKVPIPLKSRARLIGENDPIGDRVLLPCGQNATGVLELRPGYAYWAGKTYPTGAHHASVLGTVGVLLQRAREDKKDIEEDKRLSSASFRHVLLDPENFARFNDGVIQAALLRNAFPSELDYRMDNAASSRMRAILLRILKRIQEPAGEGALEFLLAIALKRLLLEEQHEKEILDTARNLDCSSALKKVIAFILRPLAEGGGAQAKPQLPF